MSSLTYAVILLHYGVMGDTERGGGGNGIGVEERERERGKERKRDGANITTSSVVHNPLRQHSLGA